MHRGYAAGGGQGDDAVAILIRAEAARTGERIRQRAGEVPRARQPLAADFTRPVPAFLLAAGRADDIVIIARKQVLERFLHTLANHCASSSTFLPGIVSNTRRSSYAVMPSSDSPSESRSVISPFTAVFHSPWVLM